MDEKLVAIFEDLARVNDGIIERGKGIAPLAAIVDNNFKIELIGMIFTDTKGKNFMRKILLKRIASKEIKGYLLFSDCHITALNSQTGEGKVQDGVVRTLYTPQEVLREIVLYENHKIITKSRSKERKKFKDEWDLWGEHLDSEQDEDALVKYEKFKKENKEVFNQAGDD